MTDTAQAAFPRSSPKKTTAQRDQKPLSFAEPSVNAVTDTVHHSLVRTPGVLTAPMTDPEIMLAMATTTSQQITTQKDRWESSPTVPSSYDPATHHSHHFPSTPASSISTTSTMDTQNKLVSEAATSASSLPSAARLFTLPVPAAEPCQISASSVISSVSSAPMTDPGSERTWAIATLAPPSTSNQMILSVPARVPFSPDADALSSDQQRSTIVSSTRGLNDEPSSAVSSLPAEVENADVDSEGEDEPLEGPPPDGIEDKHGFITPYTYYYDRFTWHRYTLRRIIAAGASATVIKVRSQGVRLEDFSPEVVALACTFRDVPPNIIGFFGAFVQNDQLCIVLERGKMVRISDFGESAILQDDGTTAGLRGTVGFIVPEIGKSNRYQGRPTMDIGRGGEAVRDLEGD
ncbi:hypothetical protein BGX33_006044 [Mortierella sp. NVP41]|nr:hypothetical protein BGX33_006044 [Mortierella sp. NVP41]